MMIRNILSTAAVALLATTALVQAKELKIGYALAEESHYGAGARAFEKVVTDGLGDAFTFRHFPSSGLGGEREVLEGIQLGTVDATIVSSGTLSNFVPEAGVFDVPFLLRDLTHARAVLDGPIGQEMLTKFEPVGMVALAWGEQGFRQITNNRNAISTPDDLKGLKIRTMENPVHIKAWEALGAAPTPMAWPEVIPALEQGAIDGQENPLSVIVSAKLNEVQKYLTLDNHVYSPAMVIVSPALWASLDDNGKQVFREAAAASAKAMRDYVEDVEKTGVETLTAAGMEVNALTPEQAAAFRAALDGPYKDYESQFGKELMDAIAAQ